MLITIVESGLVSWLELLMFDNSARKTFTIEDYEHYICFIYNIIVVSEQRMNYSQIIHDHPN